MGKPTGNKTLLSAAGATGIGEYLQVTDYSEIILAVAGDNSADLTVKVKGSVQKARPDFSAAASPSNLWDFVHVYDLEDATGKDGDTGLVLATDTVSQYIVNVSALQWLTVDVTTFTAGDVTVEAFYADNRSA